VIRDLLKFLIAHKVPSRFLGWMITTIALVGLIVMREDHHEQLGAQGGTAQGGFGKRTLTEDDMDMLLVPIGIGLTMSIQNFFRSLLAPMETLGILYKSVFQMLANDVAKWLILFAIIFVNYGYFLAYTCYPSFNTLGFDPVPDFHSPLSAMWGLLQLAMLGEGFDVNLGDLPTELTGASGWKYLAFSCFIIGLVLFIIMTLVLLLNLLIAMMGDTYRSSQEQSTLEWRVDYARRVLRLELQVKFLHRCRLMTLNCGEQITDPMTAESIWVYRYKTYERNAEGGGARGRQTSMFSEAVEDQADKEVNDDDGSGADDTDALAEMSVEASTRLSSGERPALTAESLHRHSTLRRASIDNLRAIRATSELVVSRRRLKPSAMMAVTASVTVTNRDDESYDEQVNKAVLREDDSGSEQDQQKAKSLTLERS